MSIPHRKKSAKTKGNEGEKVVHDLLSNAFPKKKTTIFRNVLLVDKSISAQLDHILVTPKAIYIIETKNYSGLIFGKASEYEWVVTYGKRSKRFYNPLWQNARHIEVLQALALETAQKYPVISVVVFSDRATLQLEKETVAHHHVITMSQLIETISELESLFAERSKEETVTVVAAIKRIKKPATQSAMSDHIRFAKGARKTAKRYP